MLLDERPAASLTKELFLLSNDLKGAWRLAEAPCEALIGCTGIAEGVLSSICVRELASVKSMHDDCVW